MRQQSAQIYRTMQILLAQFISNEQACIFFSALNCVLLLTVNEKCLLYMDSLQ